MQQVIFNTLKVETEATAQSAPSGTYKQSTSYFPSSPRVNRSTASLRSLRPPFPSLTLYPGISNSSSRAAVMERFENEPEDSETDALNITFASVSPSDRKQPRVEYTTHSRSPAPSSLDHVGGGG